MRAQLTTLAALTTLTVVAVFPSTSNALIHAGNPGGELRIRETTGWTATINNVYSGTWQQQDCATGNWTTSNIVYDNGVKIGWELPAGTWCAVQVSWTNNLDIDLHGPANRHVDASIDLPSVVVTLHNPTTTTGGEAWLIELGLGEWLTMGEVYLDPGETLVVTPPSGQHDALLDNMDDPFMYVDADKDAVISETERAAGTIGD